MYLRHVVHFVRLERSNEEIETRSHNLAHFVVTSPPSTYDPERHRVLRVASHPVKKRAIRGRVEDLDEVTPGSLSGREAGVVFSWGGEKNEKDLERFEEPVFL